MPHRTTVTFDDATWKTIGEISKETGASLADIMRRSVRMYRRFSRARALGQHVLVEQSDGTRREVLFD